jgi:two-component system cell cycle sensor histidine kinase/response regulator CckA
MSLGEFTTADQRNPASEPAAADASRVILVVDDDPMMRTVMRHQLEGGGYAVVESASGREALALLREGTAPRFLVTDLRMADGSGGWLVGQVGYEFPDLLTRTVVISGDATSAAAAHVRARWRCALLAKPFDGRQLVATITQLELRMSGTDEPRD